MAVIQAIEKILFKAETENPELCLINHLLRTIPIGYEELKAHLDKYSLEELAGAAGIPTEQLVAAAEMMKDKKRIIVCWAMGITQHKNGVDTIKEMVNLILLKAPSANRDQDSARQRSQQCTGQPDHDDLGTASRMVPR
jgi:anaerobic selenocysteine-containing dehydrogenase